MAQQFHRQPAGVGPEEAELFTYQSTHISDALFSDNPAVRNPNYFNRKLRSRNLEVEIPHHALHEYISEAGFLGPAFYKIKGDQALVSALVERWRPETHTFMLPFGEATITLEDVHHILGLKVEGDAVVIRMNPDVGDLCEELLGQRPGPGLTRGYKVSLVWLQENFAITKEEESAFNQKPDIIHQRHARAWIMRMIGGMLLPSYDSRMIDCGYLELLREFSECGQYSWASAVLAHTYRGLCNATQFDATAITAATKMITVWAYARFPAFFTVPREYVGPNDIIGYSWDNHRVKKTKLPAARAILDSIPVPPTADHWVWQPYGNAPLETAAVVVPLILNNIIEGHQPDRVMRQFGRDQPIPALPLDCDKLHNQKRTGRVDADWGNINAIYIELWNDRNYRQIRLQDYPLAVPLTFASEYMQWYARHSLRWYTSEARRQAILADGLDQIRHYDPTVGDYANYLSQETGVSYHQRYSHHQSPVDRSAPPPVVFYQPPFSLNDNPSRRAARGRPRSEVRPAPRAPPAPEPEPEVSQQSSWTYPAQPSYPLDLCVADYEENPWERYQYRSQPSSWGAQTAQGTQWGTGQTTHDTQWGQTSQYDSLGLVDTSTYTYQPVDASQSTINPWEIPYYTGQTTSAWGAQQTTASWDQRPYSSTQPDPYHHSSGGFGHITVPTGEGSSRSSGRHVPTTQAERSAMMNTTFAALNVSDDDSEEEERRRLSMALQSITSTPPPPASSWDMTLRGPDSMNPPQRYTPSEYEQARRGRRGNRAGRGRRAGGAE